MKLVLLVAVAAGVGVILADKVADSEWYKKNETVQKNEAAIRTGMTAGIGALTFGLLNRFL